MAKKTLELILTRPDTVSDKRLGGGGVTKKKKEESHVKEGQTWGHFIAYGVDTGRQEALNTYAVAKARVHGRDADEQNL